MKAKNTKPRREKGSNASRQPKQRAKGNSIVEEKMVKIKENYKNNEK